MIYEMRIYTLRPGKVSEFEALVENEAIETLCKHGKLVGWWSTDVGPLNEVVHIWAYEDSAERDRARSEHREDPILKAFRPAALSMIVSQRSLLMRAARFSPLK